jgi:hypothetical protein
MTILGIFITLILGGLGLYLTHSLRRQVKQKTADARMKSHSELWAITGVASPTRLKEWHVGTPGGPLTREERDNLYVAFTEWYYRNGNGMFLGDGTRSLYLATKDNLICPDSALKPSRLYDALQKLPEEQRSEKRGKMSIRQLSLLRARMRADLEVYGTLYFGELQVEDNEFLEYCGENLNKKPWSSQRQPDIME